MSLVMAVYAFKRLIKKTSVKNYACISEVLTYFAKAFTRKIGEKN